MGETNGDTLRTVQLIPDKSITEAIGRGHTLSTAVADIIDNSLDANAERILIRFIVEDDRLIAIRIRDDGDGMTSADLLEGMRLGRRSAYTEGALGHFGIGLKAASLSQALALTVFTRTSDAPPCAMRIRRGSFDGEVLHDRAAEDGYAWDSRGPVSTGTVVEWRDLENISHSQIASERRSWIERTINGLAHALGLTFHRLIQQRGIRLVIDTWDQKTGMAGPPRVIEARDPFQFTVSGMGGYPAVISAKTNDGARLEAECFILPPRSDSPSAWLLGRNPVEWQGIYIYRNDRLLQAGGWLDVRPEDKRLRLARMRIDLTGPLERHLRLRHEKSGVTPTPEFSAALEAATNDAGCTLDIFRFDAQEVFRASNVRTSSVKPVVPVETGLPNRVKEAIRNELGERAVDPIQFEWELLGEGQLFAMQLERRCIVFNLGYRAALGNEEVALIPTLVYLLLENYFTRDWLRDGTRAQIDAWQRVASAALLAQFGDDAYDPLVSVELTGPPMRSIMAPVPSPPSVELRWAHLGQRGQPNRWELTEPGDHKDSAVATPEQIITTNEFDTASPLDSESRNVTNVISEFVYLDDAQLEETMEVAGDITSNELRELNPQLPRSAIPPINAQPGDREIVAIYRSGADIETIASTLGAEPHDVAMRLCSLLLKLEGDDVDDQNLAAMHGEPYTPIDREKILQMYRGGIPVRRISEHLMRTPFAIGWQLLSSPKRPIEVPRSLIRRIDRSLGRFGGAPTNLDYSDPNAG